MIRLVPMTCDQFDIFMEISMRDQAQGQVQAGRWHPEEADKLIKKLRDQFLPDDLTTTGHSFFSIEEETSGAIVGGLWYMVEEENERRQFFVLDIQVYEGYRRRGYGTQAFGTMEEHAQNQGIGTISLHVFTHNQAARAMYGKLGYVGTGEAMSKEISREAG